MTKRDDLRAEAKAYIDGSITPSDEKAWRPFDQEERIRFWRKDRASLLEGENSYRTSDIKKWEEIHGHDVRLKCYPEFQCQVIESYSMDLIQRLLAELEKAVIGQ